MSLFDQLTVMRGFEHVAIPANENEAEVQELHYGSWREVVAIGRADPVAFAEGVLFVRHGDVCSAS